MPFFLWERLSAAKIAPVMGAVMLFFAPSRLRVRDKVFGYTLVLRGFTQEPR